MEVRQAIAERRARRTLDARPIRQEDLNELVQSMRLAPSCNNNQPWRVVSVSGSEALAALKTTLPKGNVWATRSPLILAICAKIEEDCRLSEGRDYFLFDCGLAVGQMMLRATELGFIAHPIAGFDPIAAKKLLNVPEGYVLLTLVICGYLGTDSSMLSEKQLAAEKERPIRKPMGENFFQDVWGNPFV